MKQCLCRREFSVHLNQATAVNGELIAKALTVDAGDQTDVSVLFDLQRDLEIALSALHIAVLMKKKKSAVIFHCSISLLLV